MGGSKHPFTETNTGNQTPDGNKPPIKKFFSAQVGQWIGARLKRAFLRGVAPDSLMCLSI